MKLWTTFGAMISRTQEDRIMLSDLSSWRSHVWRHSEHVLHILHGWELFSAQYSSLIRSTSNCLKPFSFSSSKISIKAANQIEVQFMSRSIVRSVFGTVILKIKHLDPVRVQLFEAFSFSSSKISKVTWGALHSIVVSPWPRNCDSQSIQTTIACLNASRSRARHKWSDWLLGSDDDVHHWLRRQRSLVNASPSMKLLILGN